MDWPDARDQLELQALARSLRGRALARVGPHRGGYGDSARRARDGPDTRTGSGHRPGLPAACRLPRAGGRLRAVSQHLHGRCRLVRGQRPARRPGVLQGLRPAGFDAVWRMGSAMQLSREIVADEVSVPWAHAYAHGEIGRVLCYAGSTRPLGPLLRRAVQECGALGMATIEWVLRAALAITIGGSAIRARRRTKRTPPCAPPPRARNTTISCRRRRYSATCSLGQATPRGCTPACRP